MTPRDFVEALAAVRLDNTFNPYTDLCSEFDKPDAPAIRRSNLRLVLEAAIRNGVHSVWIARDLGYRGGRRTGLALTDEYHLPAQAKYFENLSLQRATKGTPVKERTATVIWEMIESIDAKVFLWNAFPFHPYEPGNSLSNRCHTRRERHEVAHILDKLLDMLHPHRIVSIGRDAQAALEDMGVESAKVRHPSYGGQADFISGIVELYGVPKGRSNIKQPLLFDMEESLCS